MQTKRRPMSKIAFSKGKDVTMSHRDVVVCIKESYTTLEDPPINRHGRNREHVYVITFAFEKGRQHLSATTVYQEF